MQGLRARIVLVEHPLRGALALGQKHQFLGNPVNAGDQRGQHQQQRKIAFDHARVPGPCVGGESRQDHRSDRTHDGLHQSCTCKMARKASWGTSTEPICFMRFLPAFCFSRSLRFRVMSPP